VPAGAEEPAVSSEANTTALDAQATSVDAAAGFVAPGPSSDAPAAGSDRSAVTDPGTLAERPNPSSEDGTTDPAPAGPVPDAVEPSPLAETNVDFEVASAEATPDATASGAADSGPSPAAGGSEAADQHQEPSLEDVLDALHALILVPGSPATDNAPDRDVARSFDASVGAANGARPVPTQAVAPVAQPAVAPARRAPTVDDQQSAAPASLVTGVAAPGRFPSAQQGRPSGGTLVLGPGECIEGCDSSTSVRTQGPTSVSGDTSTIVPDGPAVGSGAITVRVGSSLQEALAAAPVDPTAPVTRVLAGLLAMAGAVGGVRLYRWRRDR
jgi:hypothetical protein